MYKIPAKEHQEAYRQDAEEVSVSQVLFRKYLEYVPLILHTYKKINSKIVRLKSSSFLSAQYFLVTAAQKIF